MKATTINLMSVSSYHSLTLIERQQVLLAISKPSTFFISFYNHLPHANSCIECFNQLNDLHFDIWGQYMYSSYNSFQTVYSKYLKSQKAKK